MDAPTNGPSATALGATLCADAAFEVIAGAVLLAVHRKAAGWFEVRPELVAAIGAVFLVTALPIALLASQRVADRRRVIALATANIAGGVAGWTLFAAAFRRISRPGRWLLGAIADTAVLIGLAELLALRRTTAR